MNNYRYVNVIDRIPIVLGKQGENDVEIVRWRNLNSLYRTLYGQGIFSLVVQTSLDEIYPAIVETEDDDVIWIVKDSDLVTPGYGYCELTYIVNNKIAKSSTYKVQIIDSLTGTQPSDPPAAEKNWVDNVLIASQKAQEAQIKAETAKNGAVQAKTAAETAQRGAEEAKTKAEASKEASAKSEAASKLSEQNAKASEDAAKASEDNAAGSASAAADSATASQAAQSGAEAAQSAAEQSAQQAAESAAVYDDVVADVNQLKQDVAAITPDDTAVDGKPWTSKKIVDSLCQSFEESGNPVQCYPVENYPLGVKVSWEPVQEGSGDPSPDNIRPITGRNAVQVTRCGKNLVNIPDFTLSVDTNNRTKNILVNVPAGTYTLSISHTNTSSNFGVQIHAKKGYIPSDKFPYTFTMKTDVKSIYFYIKNVEGNLDNISNIQLELGSTATPYEPYTGSTTEIALPETVYGGTFDVETGVVNTTCGHIASYAGEALPGEWISDRDVYSSGAVPTTGAQVVYKLTEPITIQLTPQQIAALSGVNTLYTDADGVIVTGAEDPKHTITELKNAIISLGGNI